MTVFDSAGVSVVLPTAFAALRGRGGFPAASCKVFCLVLSHRKQELKLADGSCCHQVAANQ